MLRSSESPNDVTMLSVLPACAHLGAIDIGRWIRVYIDKKLKGVVTNDSSLQTSLINMYAKCGDIEAAHRVFNNMFNRSLSSWNAMIFGFAMHGRANAAFDMFSRMRKIGIEPDDIMFVGLLSACSHSIQISSTGCVLFLIIFISITIVSSSPGHGEVEDETEFNYEKEGDKGPSKWGTLKPEWAMCGKGKMQSPIELWDQRVLLDHNLGYLRSNYLPSNATLKNRGHDIMLKFGGNAGRGITINGTEYQLQQLHWHSPSEHTINGKRFFLEEHMVHESKDGRITVVAFFYKLGRPDPFLFSMKTVTLKQLDLLRVSVHDVSVSNL
uniref:Alpha-carbonic anhydrase domain-containing protein n=1 Tax=Arabis nemorensis TaxID=586526 RepID=A0A565AM15_9BRAS